MALNAYMTVAGQSQGNIQGSTTQAGRENMIEVYGWSHEVEVPVSATGVPRGNRQHGPLVVTKPIDKASPKLAQALSRGESLTEVVLRAYKPDRSGREQQYFTITLTNARISSIRMEQLNNKYPENVHHEIREHVSMSFAEITQTWEDGHITWADTATAR